MIDPLLAAPAQHVPAALRVSLNRHNEPGLDPVVTDPLGRVRIGTVEARLTTAALKCFKAPDAGFVSPWTLCHRAACDSKKRSS